MYDYKGKKENWLIRPTGHPKNLFPNTKYKVNDKQLDK